MRATAEKCLAAVRPTTWRNRQHRTASVPLADVAASLNERKSNPPWVQKKKSTFCRRRSPGKLLGYEVILSELQNLISGLRTSARSFLTNDVAVVLIGRCHADLDVASLAAMIRDHPRFQKNGIIFVSAIQVTDLDCFALCGGPSSTCRCRRSPICGAPSWRVFASSSEYPAARNADAARAPRCRADAELAHPMPSGTAGPERTPSARPSLAHVHEMPGKVETSAQLRRRRAVISTILLRRCSAISNCAQVRPTTPRSRLIDGAIQGAEWRDADQAHARLRRRQRLKPDRRHPEPGRSMSNAAPLARAGRPESRPNSRPICADPGHHQPARLALLNPLNAPRRDGRLGGKLTISSHRELSPPRCSGLYPASMSHHLAATPAEAWTR